MRVVPGDDVVIAVADAVGRPPDEHLVLARLEHLDILDYDRLVHLVQDRGSRAHRNLLVDLGTAPSVILMETGVREKRSPRVSVR
jgi:hypothetical protein